MSEFGRMNSGQRLLLALVVVVLMVLVLRALTG